MATPRNTLVSTYWPAPHSSKRTYERRQAGWIGDHKSVYAYMGYRCFSEGKIQSSWTSSVIDAPNSISAVDFLGQGGIPSWSRTEYNRAYAKFRGKVVGENAELGAAFAQWRQSLDLITSSALRLWEFYTALRKGKYKKAFQSLGVDKKDRRRHPGKQGAGAASKLHLEYAFGWAPSIGDMYSAMKVLSQPLPYGKESARSTSSNIRRTGNAYDKFISRSTITHKVGADVLLINPNEFLLNQLGILNPASIAWEVMPFSFMIDWILGVQRYLSSFSDWAGLELRNPYHTHFCRYDDSWHIEKNPAFSGTARGYGTCLIRGVGIPRPIPVLQKNGDLGTFISRAASAVSILTQTLLGMKPHLT